MLRFMQGQPNESGFTLVEGVISIVILSITIIGMYDSIILARKYIVDARRVTEATNFARMKLERIMETAFEDIMSKYSDDANYDANPYDEHYCDTDPDYDQAGGMYAYENGLPSAEWKVEYRDNDGNLASSGDDPLTVWLTVTWYEGGDDRERSILLSTRLTAGRM